MSFKEFLQEKENYYPTGVYVAVLPTKQTEEAIQDFQKKHLTDVELNSKLHTTIIYSNKPEQNKIEQSNIKHIAEFNGYDLFGDDNDILVMKLKCKSLSSRFDELTDKYGFISDYDEYRPHITLAYGVQGIDLSKLPDYQGSIELDREYSEDLDDDWTPEK